MSAPYLAMSDEQLMHAYTQGDMAAFDALYQRHEVPLFRFIRRVLGAALVAQAEEVLQDCWLRIVHARASYQADLGKWKTWAYAIAHHLALDRLRVSGREWSVDQADSATGDSADYDRADYLDHLHSSALGGSASNYISAEDQAHWRAAGQQLLSCLEALPAQQRAAFLQHHEDGASVEELAQALGLGFETLKSRLRYALQKLRTCMQAYLTLEGSV